MLGKEKAQEVCEDVLRRAGHDLAEVLLFFEDHSLTRFANNHIHQNVAERNVTLMIRLLRGKRIGLSTSNRLDEESLERLVGRARANAEASPEDPDYPDTPPETEYSEDVELKAMVQVPRRGEKGERFTVEKAGQVIDIDFQVYLPGDQTIGPRDKVAISGTEYHVMEIQPWYDGEAVLYNEVLVSKVLP